MIDVKVLSRKRQAFLVSYFDSDLSVTKKCIIPVTSIVADLGETVEISDEILDMAIPYGLEWELLVQDILIPGKEIARALYENSIFSIEDFVADPKRVLGAVAQASSPVLQHLIRIIRSIESSKEF